MTANGLGPRQRPDSLPSPSRAEVSHALIAFSVTTPSKRPTPLGCVTPAPPCRQDADSAPWSDTPTLVAVKTSDALSVSSGKAVSVGRAEVDVVHSGSKGFTLTWDTSSAVWPHSGQATARNWPAGGPAKTSPQPGQSMILRPGFAPATAAKTSSNERGAPPQSLLGVNSALAQGESIRWSD